MRKVGMGTEKKLTELEKLQKENEALRAENEKLRAEFATGPKTKKE